MRVRGGGIFSHMIKRGETVNDGLFAANSLLFAWREVRDCVTTDGYEAGNTVGINIVCSKVCLIQTNHAGKVTSCGMPGDKYLIHITPVFTDVTECPCHRGSRVLNIRRAFYLREQSVVYTYHRAALIFKGGRNCLLSTAQPAAVKPYNSGKFSCLQGMVYI